MVTNKYLFASQFLKYLKSQKIEEKELFQGFATTIKSFLEFKEETDKNSLDRSFISSIVAQLQFAADETVSANGYITTRHCYLYDGFPLKRKVSCLCTISPEANMDVTKKGDFPAFDLIYLLKKEKLEWGILANGKRWRLYSILSAQPYENYLEIDFENAQEDDLRVFWQLFSLNLFIPDENEVTPLEKYIEESEKEAQVIEGHIRKNIDEILENICFGLLTYAGKDKQLLTEKEKQLYFDNAVYLLFRLLFMFYAESRELLPINDPEYRIKSLESLLEKARNWLHQGFPDANGTDLWVAFRDLCIDIGQGNSALKIPEYDGGLFDSYEHTFLSDPENQMANSYFATVLYKLGYLRKKNEETKIQYRDLSVRSLGSLYEGILA